MDRLEEIKKKFHILDDWTITMGSDLRLDGTPYTRECAFNLDQHTAMIYPWDTNKSEPSDYIFHEVLHIAFRVASISREYEELFIQDLCIQLEIEQLKKELESALIESCKYFDCSYREALKEK